MPPLKDSNFFHLGAVVLSLTPPQEQDVHART
jgi:hypothetical protein